MTTQRSDSSKDKQREGSSKGGHASHSGSDSKSSSGNTRGGNSEQHAKAGRESHKNS